MPRNLHSTISEGERGNRSAAQKARWAALSPTERATRLACVHSPESKKRGQDVRAAFYIAGNKRTPTPQVVKDKQRAALLGIPHSAERKQAIRTGVLAALAEGRPAKRVTNQTG